MEEANLTRHVSGLSRRNVTALALGALALPIAGPALGRGIEVPATQEDEKFMRLALEEAALGDYPYSFGAVIVATARCSPEDAISGTSNRTRRRTRRWSPFAASSPSMGSKS